MTADCDSPVAASPSSIQKVTLFGHSSSGKSSNNSSASSASSGGRVSRLQTTLSSLLVRGVPLHRALAGYGEHWTGSTSGKDEFDLSAPTRVIDDFISHDWRTPYPTKILTLLHLYNSKAAILASMLFGAIVLGVSVAVGKLGEPLADDAASPGLRVLTDNSCAFFCPVVYFIVMFHWHDVSALLCNSRLLFLDKLCINQHDEELKRKAIMSLAAFLKHSRRMVVLWSPNYFNRLWCTYELAAWMHFGKPTSDIVLLPVALPWILVVCTLHWSFLPFVRSIVYHYCGVDASYWNGMPLLLVYGHLGGIVLTYIEAGVFSQVLVLDEQLAEFRIHNAQCFCCTNGHVHPSTGVALPCDRKLIYQALEDWHGGPAPHTHLGAGGALKGLEAFDSGVRTMLRDHVLSVSSAKTWRPSYIQCLCCTIPLMWDGFDHARRACIARHAAGALTGLLHSASRSFVAGPCFIITAAWIISKGSRLVKWTELHRGRRLAAAFLVWVPVMSAPYMMIWIPGALMPLWMAVLWYTAQALFLLRYFWSSLPCMHASGQTPGPDEHHSPPCPEVMERGLGSLDDNMSSPKTPLR
eukprot:TRINITY_DN18019_c0_g1_i1.p1 TRINITY_DN18019_c0_g1~~TRINITY_DN18019_c0_g1_i1.p1  ORF type:complete len:581 (+),score=61.78 TRINITY_DN18019_c0_g1_i1:129-1871(+)